jgi:hypothetical protein
MSGSSSERAKVVTARARSLPGQPCVSYVGDDIKQLFDTIAADRRHDPELRKMGTDRIDHCGGG